MHRFSVAGFSRILLTTVAVACGGSGADRGGTNGRGGPAEPAIPPTPVISLSSDSVVAASLAGASVTTQTIAVAAGGTANVTNLAVAASDFGAGDSGNWLTATLDGNSAPATLSVRLDPGTATPGLHTASVTVSAQGASAKTIRIRFTIRPRPLLLVDANDKAITSSLGDAIPVTTVDVRSSSDTIGKLAVETPTCESGHWLSATLGADATPTTLALAVDARGLAAGTFVCQVSIRTTQALVDSATRVVTVRLTLRQTPRIVLDLADLRDAAVTGADGSQNTIHITNGGSGVLDRLSVGAIDYGTGPEGWLTATLDSTTAPATLRVTTTAKSLARGTYVARIPVLSAAPGVANSPAFATLTLTVNPKPFQLVITPSALSFAVKDNGSVTVVRSVSMFDGNNSGTPATLINLDLANRTGLHCGLTYTLSTKPDPQTLPLTWTFTISAPPSGASTCTYLWRVTLNNGATGTFSMTVTSTP